MVISTKEEHIICNWCEAEINDSIGKFQYFKGKDNQLDFCDDYCENKFQSDCEHNNRKTDKATYAECQDCGKISQDPRL